MWPRRQGDQVGGDTARPRNRPGPSAQRRRRGDGHPDARRGTPDRRRADPPLRRADVAPGAREPRSADRTEALCMPRFYGIASVAACGHGSPPPVRRLSALRLPARCRGLRPSGGVVGRGSPARLLTCFPWPDASAPPRRRSPASAPNAARRWPPGLCFARLCRRGRAGGAAPRPLAVVKYAPITMEPEGFVPFEEMRAGWPGPAWIGRFDDHDQPEPDATFYTGGIFAGGTASTFNVAPPRYMAGRSVVTVSARPRLALQRARSDQRGPSSLLPGRQA